MHGIDLLRFAEGVGFTLLGVANVLAWRRAREDRRHLHLALALGPLGLLSLLGQLDDLTPNGIPGMAGASMLLFLASAYGLLEFRNDFMRYATWVRRAARWTIVLAGLLSVAVRFPRGETPALSPIQIVAAIVVILLWCASSLEPSLRFWLAARTRPTVQRARMRVLAFACASIGGLLVVMLILGPLARRPWFDWVVHTVSIVTIPLLYASFAPPAWLRRAWRRREEDTLLHASDDLSHYLPDLETAAARGLEGAIRLFGAEAGFVTDPGGRILARIGTGGEHAVTVPLRMAEGVGSLTVLSGPFTPLFGSDEVARLERLAHTVEIAIDRTRLSHEVASEHARYESLMHAVSDLGEGVVVTEGTRLVYANDAYLTITGYTFEALTRLESLFELAPEDERERLLDQYRRRNAGEQVSDHFETALIRRDGRRVEVEVALKLLARDGVTQIIAIVRDITERVASDGMKSAFLSAVSHELRTPLTAVLGFAKTLEHQGDRIGPEERRTFLARLSLNAEKLDRLLSDLLDVDRLSRGLLQPVRRPTDIGALILRVVDESPALASRRIRVDAGSLNVRVDGPKVERIIENLVANAVRHTPPGSSIWIRAAEFELGVLIAVEDEGRGVSPELREAVFEPFKQGPGIPLHAPGVGIGLSLVARFAELHGGRAWVEDRPGGGASFRVYLPGAPASVEHETMEPLLHSPS